jgi:hypothetical protein
MIRPVLILTMALPLWSEQTSASRTLSATPRPVWNVTKAPSVAAVEFVDFEFQQPTPMHVSLSLYDIRTEPSIGARYVVEANIGGEEAIAAATFEVVDANGSTIQPLVVAAKGTGVPGEIQFIGLMTVPAQPFRIALNGQGVDGSHFRRVFGRLFRPVQQPPSALRGADLPAEMAKHFQRLIDEEGPKLVAEVEMYVADHATVPLVIPRTEVSNVMYAPLLSPAGRPIGMRVTYDVEFSERGRFNPKVRVHPMYDDMYGGSSFEMRVLSSKVEPLPRTAHAPEKPAGTGFRDSVLAYGADFLYEARTVYHFTLDLVPSYVHTIGERSKPCFLHQRFELARDPEKAFAQMLASEGPTTYRVYIGGEAFEGRIEGFAGEGAFYRSFVAEGTQECPRPAIR